MSDDLRDCECPKRDGMIYHQRETCTDPIAKLLNWYADSNPEADHGTVK
jgi:hypothetical protein